MRQGNGGSGDPSAIVTVPNAISFVRILLIPVFCYLLARRGTEAAGLLLFVFVAATDWVDGYVARRTGRVSEVGKVLDPVADRLAIAAAVVTLVVRGAFPLWAAALIVVRDVAVIAAGAALLAGKGARIDVRFVGKIATFTLMVAVPLVAWGSLDLPLGELALATGWTAFGVGIAEYYVAAAVYVGDLRRALATT